MPAHAHGISEALLARGAGDLRLVPMGLLHPCRILADEGLLVALRFVWRVLRTAAAGAASPTAARRQPRQR